MRASLQLMVKTDIAEGLMFLRRITAQLTSLSRTMSTIAELPPGNVVTVDAQWLRQNIGAKNLAVLDSSWYLPSMNRNAAEEYTKKRIPTAVHFDIDKVCDPKPGVKPHAFPPRSVFESHMRALGLKNDDIVVCYDTHGLFSAGRAWLMLKMYRHESVVLLDGGLPAWEAAGGKVLTEDDPIDSITPSNYSAENFDNAMFRTMDDMLKNVQSRKEVVVDARSNGRFTGTEPEPRPGISSGHMPGSVNVPLPSLLDEQNRLKPVAELQQIFKDAGVPIGTHEPLITSCGSGVMASSVFAGLRKAGYAGNIALFDGSWTEYAQHPDAVIEK